MKPGDEFARFVAELFASLGSISTRRMFGGHGIYCDGLMFALIADEVLYLKADEVSQPHYQAAHCTPFVYPMRGKPVAMSYWRIPDEALESPALAAPWGRRALESALRRANLAARQPARHASPKPAAKRSKRRPSGKRAS